MNARAARAIVLDRGFLALLSINFVLGLTSACVLPFVSLWATREVGMSSRMLGLFMAVSTLSAILLSTLIARWSDAGVSRRTVLLVGSTAGCAGYLGFACTGDPVVLMLIGSSALAVASINFAQFFAYVREHLERDEHARADVPLLMGVLRASYALAWTVGPLGASRVITRFGYAVLFVTTAALFALFACGVLAFVSRDSAAGRRERSEPAAWGFGEPLMLAYALAFALMFAAFTLKGLNLPLMLTERLGATEHGVGAAFAVSPVFEILFMVGFGQVAALGHQWAVMVLGSMAAVAYFSALPFVTAVWHVYPLQVLNAAAVAVTTSVAIPFFQDLMPAQRGVATNLYSSALKAGSLLGFSAFGVMAGHLGHTSLFWTCAALSAATLIMLVITRGRTAAVRR